jgi:hypothetical protein
MVRSFAARPRAAGWSTKDWSQGIPYLVHVGNLKSLGITATVHLIESLGEGAAP